MLVLLSTRIRRNPLQLAVGLGTVLKLVIVTGHGPAAFLESKIFLVQAAVSCADRTIIVDADVRTYRYI